MRRVLRWMGFTLGGLVGVVVVALAVAYALSERQLRRTYDLPPVALAVPTDALSIAEGRRMAVLHGCMSGCHGQQGEGDVLVDDPLLGRIVAPNLTAAAQHYSGTELARIIRHGLRPDGRSVMIMPSKTYGGLDDADLGRLVAYLGSLPPLDGPGPSVALGPLGRIGLAIGKFRTARQEIEAIVELPPADGANAARGRYLARSICTECHGSALQGDSNPSFSAPTLQVIAAYAPDDFARLMKTGIATGGRTVGMMTGVSKRHLSQLTDPEIAALYDYLHAFATAKGT